MVVSGGWVASIARHRGLGAAMDGGSRERVQLNVSCTGSRMAKNNDPKRQKDDALASEIDALLKKLPQADPGLVGRPAAAARPPSTAPVRPAPATEPRTSSPIAVWARVVLGAVFGVALTQWPYRTDCGWPLLGYAAAVAVLLLTAGWCTVTTWRHRAGIAHIVSLLLGFWGIVLSASILLPRIGYAADAATWRCPAPVPASPPRAAPAPVTEPPPAAPGVGEAAPETPGLPDQGGEATPPDSTGG